MHTAFLLAAGLGTRLRPLTLVRPKPLLPICGVPMLDHALALVRDHGHRSVLVNAHHLWEQVAAWVAAQDQAHDDVHVALQLELPEILGTGGGLRAALPGLGPHVVVVNGDILCDIDLQALVACIPAGGAAMALRQLAPGEQITSVEAAGGRVTAIGNVVGALAADGGAGVPGTHFTGIHAMSRDAVARVPAEGFQCVVRTAYKALIPEAAVGALMHGGTWVDVGRPDDYLAANLAVLRGAVRPPVDPWSRGERGPGGSWLGAGARLEGAVRDCVVGAGATVPADADLARCVVWDGVTVPGGSWSDCVFYGDSEAPGGGVLVLDGAVGRTTI